MEHLPSPYCFTWVGTSREPMHHSFTVDSQPIWACGKERERKPISRGKKSLYESTTLTHFQLGPNNAMSSVFYIYFNMHLSEQ